MANKFDRFTKRARQTLTLAQEEAHRLKHNYIGTEHLLLGLIKETRSLAPQVLQELGVDLNQVQKQIEQTVGHGQRLRIGNLKLTPRVKRVIELAVNEARQLGQHYIGTEHLLLGLLREGEGIAVDVLKTSVSLADVEAKLAEIMAQNPVEPGQGDVVADKPDWSEFVASKLAELRAKFAELAQGKGSLTVETTREEDLFKAHLRNILDQLPERERRVLEMRFGLTDGQEHTLEAVGQAFGITRERIEQIEGKVLRILRSTPQPDTPPGDPLMNQIYEIVSREERNRLARDLHDSIKQQIFSISVSAAAVEARWDNDPAGARAALVDVQRSAQAAMVEMNALLQQLRPDPLETVGLLEALREQCQALDFRTGAEVTTAFGELPLDAELPVGSQETIFRIAQEALGNIARHARATQVRVQLESDLAANLLRLEISDNGQGFDITTVSGGMGLVNMRTRAEGLRGRLIIDSAPAQGTTIQVEIPLLEAV